MAIIINGTSYSGKNGIKTGGDFYSKVVLDASVTGSPTVGTAFSALTVSASITLPDLGINTPISVTGFTRSNGTVAAGTNTMTVTWKGISKVVTFSAAADPGTPGISLSQSAVTVTIGAGSWVVVNATLNGGLTGSVEWSISPEDENIMIGSDGTPNKASIKALAGATAGAYTLTATLGGHTATCAVTVAEAGGGEDDPGTGTQTLPNFGTVAMPPESAQLIGTSTVTFTTAWVSGAISMKENVGNTLVFTFGNEIDISTVKYIRMTSDFSGVDLDAISTAFIAVGALTVNGQLGFDQEMTAGDGQTLFGTGGNASGIGWGHVNSGGQWTNQANSGQEAEIKVTVSGSTLTQIHLRVGNACHYLCNGQKITFELYGDETA